MEQEVFISHSSRNKQKADEVCSALEKSGIHCWIAPRDIPVGSEYPKEIVGAVEKCKIFLVIFTKAANTSEDVRRELGLAIAAKKKIISFRIENIENDLMDSNFKYYLRDLQWLDADLDDKEYRNLVEVVSQILSSIPNQKKEDNNGLHNHDSKTDSNKFEEIHKRYSEYKEKLILDAEAGNNESRYILGNDYLIGNIAFEQDYSEAYKWLKLAADEDYLPAIHLMGWFYYRAYFDDKQDFEKALYWFKKAADKNHQHSCMQVGFMYRFGLGCEQDFEEAIKYYTKADYYDASSALGTLYEDFLKDFKKAEYHYKKASSASSYACYRLGMLYWYGVGNEKPNYIESRRWLGEAAEKGSTAAKHQLGALYYYGNGFPQDYVEARYWYEQAADKGNVDAQYTLAWLHLHGLGTPKDATIALALFKKAADQGHTLSQGHAGDIYFRQKDYKSAFDMHKKAADQGLNNSRKRLGDMYALGLGCKVNHGKSVEYYQLAAEQGDVISGKSLELQSMPLLEV